MGLRAVRTAGGPEIADRYATREVGGGSGGIVALRDVSAGGAGAEAFE